MPTWTTPTTLAPRAGSTTRAPAAAGRLAEPVPPPPATPPPRAGPTLSRPPTRAHQSLRPRRTTGRRHALLQVRRTRGRFPIRQPHQLRQHTERPMLRDADQLLRSPRDLHGIQEPRQHHLAHHSGRDALLHLLAGLPSRHVQPVDRRGDAPLGGAPRRPPPPPPRGDSPPPPPHNATPPP